MAIWPDPNEIVLALCRGDFPEVQPFVDAWDGVIEATNDLFPWVGRPEMLRLEDEIVGA